MPFYWEGMGTARAALLGGSGMESGTVLAVGMYGCGSFFHGRICTMEVGGGEGAHGVEGER